MRSLVGSLADGVLADAILISPHPPILAHQYKEVKGVRETGTETSNTKNIY